MNIHHLVLKLKIIIKSSIYLNKHNGTVQFSNTSYHKLLIIYLEIQQGKEITNEEVNQEGEENIFYENSTTD